MAKQQRPGSDASADNIDSIPYIGQPEILGRIARYLAPNDVACGLRLLNKAASRQFNDHNVLCLSHPLPVHVLLDRWGAAGSLQRYLRTLTLGRRRRLLCAIAAIGQVHHLGVAISAVGLLPFAAVAEAAAAAGQLAVCVWLYERGWPLGRSLITAASAGCGTVCEVLYGDYGCEADVEDAVEAAYRGGHHGLVEWLVQCNRPSLDLLCATPSLGLFCAALEGCPLKVVKQLRSRWQGKRQLRLRGRKWALAAAAAAGSFTADWQAKVEWLQSRCRAFARHAAAYLYLVCSGAARRPDAVERLRWLRQRGYPVRQDAVEAAAGADNVAAVQYLLGEMGVHVWDFMRVRISLAAASSGHLAFLQLLHSHGWDLRPPDSARRAAHGGHLAVVAWLVETFSAAAVRLGPDLFKAAALSGSVPLLAWLREKGCDWDMWTFSSVARSGCEVALEWLVEQRCPMPAEGEPYVEAARNGDQATLTCLRRLGCPWGPNASSAFIGCAILPESPDTVLPALRWMVEAGCPVDWDHAIRQVELEVRLTGPRRPSPEVREWLLGEQRRLQEEQARREEERRRRAEGHLRKGVKRQGKGARKP